jgi:hypothetical protein
VGVLTLAKAIKAWNYSRLKDFMLGVTHAI